MTHRKDYTPFEFAMNALIENGYDGMASAIELLFNDAMKIERSAFIGAGPYERRPERNG